MTNASVKDWEKESEMECWAYPAFFSTEKRNG